MVATFVLPVKGGSWRLKRGVRVRHEVVYVTVEQGVILDVTIHAAVCSYFDLRCMVRLCRVGSSKDNEARPERVETNP